jgi:hypothetical protein
MPMKRLQSKTNINEGAESMHNEVKEMELKEEVSTEENVIGVNENINVTVTNEDNNIDDIVINATPFSAKNVVRTVSGVGSFSVIKAKTGNRTVLSKQGYEHLGKPKTMQYAFNPTSIVIGVKLPNNSNDFNVKDTNGKGIVYSTPLVREIAERFELSFDDRTSMTFGDIQYTQNGDEPVIIIKIK